MFQVTGVEKSTTFARDTFPTTPQTVTVTDGITYTNSHGWNHMVDQSAY